MSSGGQGLLKDWLELEKDRVVSGNPRYPTLTGTKLRGLSDALRINVRMLKAHFTSRWYKARDAWRGFRKGWGLRPPANEAEWRRFWHEYSLIEDGMSDFVEEIRAIFADTEELLDNINDIIAQNGVVGLDGDPVSSLRLQLETWDEMLTELRQW